MAIVYPVFIDKSSVERITLAVLISAVPGVYVLPTKIELKKNNKKIKKKICLLNNVYRLPLYRLFFSETINKQGCIFN